MRNGLFVFIAAIFVCSTAQSMPLGLRTAAWGIAAANRRVEIERLLPADCEEAELPTILSAFADAALIGHITNKTEYAEFREWALDSGSQIDALLESQMTWRSFALCAALLAMMPEEGDLVIDELNAVGDGNGIEIVFSLADVKVGMEALEARLKTVFDVVGATTLGDGGFASDNLSFALSPTGDGRVKAVIEPKRNAQGNAPSSFFMKVEMN